jgi:hypothetical protein
MDDDQARIDPDLSKDAAVPFRKREAAEHAKQEQHFKEIEKSLKDATALLLSSKREIERSNRITKDTDQPGEEPAALSQQPTNDR